MDWFCRISWILIAPVAFCAAGATAQDVDGSAYFSALKDCQSLTVAEARLACFDREVAAVLTASDVGAVRVVAEEEMRETRRGLFGFSLPKVKLFGADSEEMELMESVITSARRIKADQWVFEIADGDAVWQINNAPMRLRKIEPGQKVVFKRASMGSYFIRINGQLGVKGRRIR